MKETIAASTQDIRKENRCRILGILRKKSELARNEIAKLTNLTEPAISRITRELVVAKVIEEVETTPAQSRRGRPIIGLRLNGDFAYVAAMNLSADSQWVCIANLKGEILAKKNLIFNDMTNPVVVISSATNELKKLIRKSNIRKNRLVGAGITVAGPVDINNGTLIESPNLGWPTLPLAAMIEAELNLPTKVESRSTALLLAEQDFTAPPAFESAALILPALGIGGAIMADGRIVRGKNSRAGQIGHLKVEKNTLLCTCGRTGCLDTIASGHAILEHAGYIPKGQHKPVHRVEHAKLLEKAVSLAVTDNEEIMQILFRAGQHLGHALKALVTISDPEMIFLAGQLGQSNSYSAGVRQSFSEYSPVPIISSKVTYEDAAISLALRAFIYNREFEISSYLTD